MYAIVLKRVALYLCILYFKRSLKASCTFLSFKNVIFKRLNAFISIFPGFIKKKTLFSKCFYNKIGLNKRDINRYNTKKKVFLLEWQKNKFNFFKLMIIKYIVGS